MKIVVFLVSFGSKFQFFGSKFAGPRDLPQGLSRLIGILANKVSRNLHDLVDSRTRHFLVEAFADKRETARAEITDQALILAKQPF